MLRILTALCCLVISTGICLAESEKPLKVFLLAGQSNMVGWGDSTKLPLRLREGSERVLMFEKGKWQPLRPHKPASPSQKRRGMTEHSFGPEIAFGHAMAEAWPENPIGIVKFAVGGTSILTWKPDWSFEDANRVGQGRAGSLYKRLMDKLAQARQGRQVEVVGVLWIQGGGDMKHLPVAKEYLENLKSLIAALRKDLGHHELPFLCGSSRRSGDPADLSDLNPQRVSGPYPAVEFVLKAQWDVQNQLPMVRTVILRDIETHPMNVHYNTPGQLQVGRLFAKAYLELIGDKKGAE